MNDEITPPAWMADALCAQVSPELWFPEPGGDNGAQAKRICREACPVRANCLAYSLADDTLVGIWGGIGTRQRARLRKQAA